MNKFHPYKTSSSANGDGFYAKLELREEHLYLPELAIGWYDGTDSTVLAIELKNEEGIFCDWFSGELQDVTYGKQLSRTKIVSFKIENGIHIEKKIKKKPFWKHSL